MKKLLVILMVVVGLSAQTWESGTGLVYTNGNVGIGKDKPSEALDVVGNIVISGTIVASKVKITVDVAGADFVFEDDYKLRSLMETEKFIKENKHLPEIPSAKEMKENGLDMSEFQIKLLQKIEELTIHMIEMKKENISLRSEMNALKKEK